MVSVSEESKVIRLAAPRGFCDGVDRAVRIVEGALEKFGQPVYVRHEIVHNRFVVDGLAAKGAVFVEELDEVPEGAPVVFSAHGVAKAVVAEADIIEDRKPLEAAVLAVMGHHSYRSPSLRSAELPYLSCPRLTPREYEVLDRLARGMSDREIAEDLIVTEETARTYTKRLLRTLEVNNRVQAVLKGMRCGMVQI